MSQGDDKGYVLQNYDYILIVASWGAPKEYTSSRYVLEVEGTGKSDKRDTVSGDDEKYGSSTIAIKDLLQRKIGIPKEKIDLLIFCQDTILIDNIEKIMKKKPKWTRKDLQKDLLSELYKQTSEEGRNKIPITKELNIWKPEDYEKFVKFVPGVITRVEGSCLYTWRTEHCYDLLLGGIILYTYDKLRNIQDHPERIVILLDTTHGINYFATALKEGVLRAAALYAFDRFIESINYNTVKKLKELVVYHYNSDPLSKSEDTPSLKPSLKIHMLDKVCITEDDKILLNRVFAGIEEQVSREGLEGLGKRLGDFWKGVEWEKITEALLLLSRGILVWALRAACSMDSFPTIKNLEDSFIELEIKFSEDNGKEYKIDYHSPDRNPIAQVIEFAILANNLRDMADKVSCTKDTYSEGFRIMEEISEKLRTELAEKDLYDKIQNIIKNNDRYVCFDLGKLEEAASIYTSPYSDIIKNEIENIRNYLTKEERIKWWKKVSNHIYAEPRDRPAYIVEYEGARILLSIPNSVEERNFYAHAGLAYGLSWFALKRGEDIILCLGDDREILSLLQRKKNHMRE